MVRIGDPTLHKRVHTRQDVFSGTRDDFRNDAKKKFVAVPGGTAIVRLEDQPAIGGGQTIPLIPVSLEVVSVGIGGTPTDERQPRQMLGFGFGRWVNTQGFDRRSLVLLP